MKRLILIIDDNVQFIQDLSFYMRDQYDVISATTGKEGLTLVRMQEPDVVLLDMKLQDGESGLEVLRKIKNVDPDMPVIIVTDYPEVETAVEAMRLGAEHYASKSPKIGELKAIIEQQIRNLPWRKLYREEMSRQYGQLIGDSPAMQKIRSRIEQLAKTDLPVLILGASGTGKELVANSIHRQSARSGHMIVTVNCSTLAPNLFESEFFGHEKGAFTGAISRKKGKIELAEHGTLFLDEIGDLPLESQAKILEAIEYKRYQRLGGEVTLHADVRIIAATNRDLRKSVEERSFRDDLYYRLEAIMLFVPPLRERREDIPELAQHYLELACREIKCPVPRVSDRVMAYWQSLPWPGNVRELRNKMMQVALDTDGDWVNAEADGLSGKHDNADGFYQSLFAMPYSQAKGVLLKRFQIEYIKRALVQNNFNISKTAEQTGVHRSTVHRVLRNENLK